MKYVTPIDDLSGLSQKLCVDLKVKRDDLLPLSGGGNKVRKAYKIFKTALREGYNSVFTAGGTQSNHARVVALFAAQYAWPCLLALHGEISELSEPKGNLLLMRMSGAEINISSPDQISSTMEHSMIDLKNRGFKPYEIPGGGHCIDGAMAYYDAALELKNQLDEKQWTPDWIILASGTGTTQAGILVGIEHIGWDTKVIGVSVARKNPRGRSVVDQSCKELRKYLGKTISNELNVDFRDNWIGDGYEKADCSVFSAIRMAAQDGLILDTTYTGKAFRAMLDLIASGEIKKGGKVLFWHTGGLLNLFASNYIGEIIKS